MAPRLSPIESTAQQALAYYLAQQHCVPVKDEHGTGLNLDIAHRVLPGSLQDIKEFGHSLEFLSSNFNEYFGKTYDMQIRAPHVPSSDLAMAIIHLQPKSLWHSRAFQRKTDLLIERVQHNIKQIEEKTKNTSTQTSDAPEEAATSTIDLFAKLRRLMSAQATQKFAEFRVIADPGSQVLAESQEAMTGVEYAMQQVERFKTGEDMPVNPAQMLDKKLADLWVILEAQKKEMQAAKRSHEFPSAAPASHWLELIIKEVEHVRTMLTKAAQASENKQWGLEVKASESGQATTLETR